GQSGVSGLIGTTAGGGKYNSGTMFLIGGYLGYGVESVVHDFCSEHGSQANPCLDGVAPVGDIVSTDLAFYGTAQAGGWGNPGYGVAFLWGNGNFEPFLRFCNYG